MPVDLADQRFEPGALIHTDADLFEVIELLEPDSNGYRFLHVRNERSGACQKFGIEFVARAFTLLRAAPAVPNVAPVAA